jgi:cinnamoyl-CoA reductase
MYSCTKMMAEIAATEEAAKRSLELAVVVPATKVGPMLQRTVNFSTDHVTRYLTGAKRGYPNAVTAYADVRDVARAHALVYERPDARGRRFLCLGAVLHHAQFVRICCRTSSRTTPSLPSMYGGRLNPPLCLRAPERR